jgi:hypothetical protein
MFSFSSALFTVPLMASMMKWGCGGVRLMMGVTRAIVWGMYVYKYTKSGRKRMQSCRFLTACPRRLDYSAALTLVLPHSACVPAAHG